MSASQTLAIALVATLTACAGCAGERAARPMVDMSAAEIRALEDTYLSQTFDGFLECYTRHAHHGPIKGRLSAVITTRGRIDDATYVGKAPKPVRRCLVVGLSKRYLPHFMGPAAAVLLEYDGTTEQPKLRYAFERIAPQPAS